MNRYFLAAALALAATLTFSEVASAHRYFWGGPYGVTTGGGYQVVPGPVPYSTLMVPAAPTTTYVGPFGHVHYYGTPVVSAYPAWYY